MIQDCASPARLAGRENSYLVTARRLLLAPKVPSRPAQGKLAERAPPWLQSGAHHMVSPLPFEGGGLGVRGVEPMIEDTTIIERLAALHREAEAPAPLEQ